MPMYSGLDDPRRWRLCEALDEHAGRQGDREWLTTTDGQTWTFATAADQARRLASCFAARGVRAGDRVGVLLPNGLDFVRVWLALQYRGAIGVLLNTGLSGPFLTHQLNNSGVERLVTTRELAPVVRDAIDGSTPLRQLVLVDADEATDDGYARWITHEPWTEPLPAASDTACVMYTSGTSGPAKGVLMPHAHCALYGIGALRAFDVRDGDRYYVALPLFHSNGLLMQLGTTLLAGIPATVRTRFSASDWIGDIARCGATLTHLLGALAAFVLAQPASRDDRQHRLRALLNGPNPPAVERALRERYGVADVISGYGMTEVNIPIWGRVGHATAGAAGWVDTRHFEVLIADPDTDAARPPGELGEILVRPRVPFGFMAGYLGMPERTVEAWRNLWFHTGDAGTMAADGLVTFVDRIKDCIRRRGENIAPAEIEALAARLEGVSEVAAYPVPSELPGGEDEVMLAIVPAGHGALDLVALGERLDALLPRFARPRYLLAIDELPKTATGKVQRAELRRRGCVGALDRGAGPRTRTHRTNA